MQNLLYYQRTSEIDDNMIYKKAAEHQMIFLRDTICHSIGWVTPFVISFHTSKSVLLPVYGFTMKNGIKIICRNNFYNWKISVELPRPIGKTNAIPEDLLTSYGKKIHSCYCEGFKNEWVYDAYVSNDPTLTKFTVDVGNDYRFYTLMYFLKHLFEDMSFDDVQYSKDEITKAIEKVNSEQGVNDIRTDNRLGFSNTKPVMSGWELWNETYNAIDNTVKYITDKKGLIHKDIDFDFETADSPEKFAEFIISNNEAYNAFKWEYYQYTQKF